MPVREAITTPEAGLISLALRYPEVADRICELPADIWSQAANRTVAAVIRDLLMAGDPANLVTVSEALKRKGLLRAVGGNAWLAELTGEAPFLLADHERLAESVRRAYVIRELRGLGHGLSQLKEDSDVERIMSMLDQRMGRVRDAISSAEPTPLGQILDDRLMNVYGRGDADNPPVRVGVKSLDRVFRGFRPGEITVLAARTHMGKTHFALHCAKACALDAGKAALIVSLEMSEGAVVDRLYASEAGINTEYLTDPEAMKEPKALERLAQAARTMRAAPIYVTRRHQTTLEIRSACSRILRERGLGLVVIDYLDMIADQDGENDVDRLGRITRRLRAMSMDLEVPVLLVHQVNRRTEDRSDKRPNLADLRGSGHIENAADAVLLLYRPAYYDANDAHVDGYTEVIVAKQRSGRVGTVGVHLNLETSKISSLDDVHPFWREMHEDAGLR